MDLPRREPVIRVGLLEGAGRVKVELRGEFSLGEGPPWKGPVLLRAGGEGGVRVETPGGRTFRAGEILFSPLRAEESSFLVRDMPIGIGFHWEQAMDQAFRGRLEVRPHPSGGLLLVNRIPLEDYLESVLSSEMNPASPPEFLLAHAVTSRSWLAAQLAPSRRPPLPPSPPGIRWRDRADHELFDVCADDHCQRYQGIPRRGREGAARAVRRTRGVFLLAKDGRVCDARFSKACGGRTEVFSTAWEDREVPCLASVRCWEREDRGPLRDEGEARAWIRGRPPSFCADPPEEVRRVILPGFDLATRDFYRWRVEYGREELEGLLLEKGGIRVGRLLDLVPLKRGPSGRISILRILGTEGEAVAGKELEIRRILSPTHLYSSAFLVRREPEGQGPPLRFRLEGAGWGHGVGLCQVGAAVMAWRGWNHREILARYFPGSRLERLYG